MANNSMIRVGTSASGLAACPTPSAMTWGLQDVSSSDAGRTDDALMHKNRVAQKRTLSFTWNIKAPGVAAQILQMFNPEYVYVQYHDPMLNAYTTRLFYVGDRTAPVKTWTVGNKLYESISFDIIER